MIPPQTDPGRDLDYWCMFCLQHVAGRSTYRSAGSRNHIISGGKVHVLVPARYAAVFPFGPHFPVNAVPDPADLHGYDSAGAA
jgi:hypothetical protein